MSKSLAATDVSLWTKIDVITWLKFTQTPQIRGITRDSLEIFDKLALTGKCLVGLISNDSNDALEQFHEYCLVNFKIKTYGTRERLYYAILNLQKTRVADFVNASPVQKFQLFISSSTSLNEDEIPSAPTGISNWEIDDVEKWLHQHMKHDEVKEIIGIFQKENIDGYVLYKILTREDLCIKIFANLGISSDRVHSLVKISDKLYHLIKIDLSRDLEMELPDECIPILQKIRSSDILSKKFNTNDPILIRNVLSLCDKDLFKKRYLSMDWRVMKEELIEEEKSPYQEEDIVIRDTFQNEIKCDTSLSVKLLISELRTTKMARTMVQTISPVLDFFSLSAHYGLFHTALIVGCWLFEWNNGEIVIPRYPLSSVTTMSFEIGEIEINHPEDLERVKDLLADHCIQWNVSMMYAQQSHDTNKSGNCQDFVDLLIKKLGIRIDYQSTGLETYLKRLRKDGISEATFRLTPEFKEEFKIKSEDFKNLRDEEHPNDLYFKTHEDLDKFCGYLKSINLEFELTYKYEWNLLKGFDRAFWLRHYAAQTKHKRVIEYIPYLDKDLTCLCPFNDPKDMSFITHIE